MRVLSIVTLIIIGIVSVLSQDEFDTKDFTTPTQSAPQLPPGITTAFVFPDYPDRKITLGEPIEVLLAFVNHGYTAMNITHMSAGLSHPLDRNYYIQNYSKAEYGLTVNPNEQISVSYRFRPDTMLDPRDYGLVAIVYYHDEVGRQHASPFFNGTITLIEPHTVFDFQQFTVYVFFLAIIGGATYYYTQVYAPSTASGSKKTKSKYVPPVYEEYGSKRKVTEDDEWLQGTNVLPSKSPKQVRNKVQVNSEIKEKVHDLKENQAKKEKVHKEINKEIKEVVKTKQVHNQVNKEIKEVGKTKEAHKEINKEIKDVGKTKEAHKEVAKEIKSTSGGSSKNSKKK